MFLKRVTCCIFLLIGSILVHAQLRDEITFEMITEVPTTGIKNQQRTSTCWSFATVSMIESGTWIKKYEAILDKHLGKPPVSFIYRDKPYSPETFLQYLELETSGYILLSSFLHHPFYTSFVLEVPDNWSWGEVYNVPMHELEQVIDSSLINGYSISWSADVSEPGFKWQEGLAYLTVDEDDTDQNQPSKKGMHATHRNDNNRHTNSPVFNEPEANQRNRQHEFDHHYTTDDHGMQIVGIAQDQYGNKYYKVKNSWGEENNRYNGYLYATRNYVLSKTTSLLFNKQAIPDFIENKPEF